MLKGIQWLFFDVGSTLMNEDKKKFDIALQRANCRPEKFELLLAEKRNE